MTTLKGELGSLLNGANLLEYTAPLQTFQGLSETRNTCLLCVYLYMVAQRVCLQMIPVANKMMLGITTIFPIIV